MVARRLDTAPRRGHCRVPGTHIRGLPECGQASCTTVADQGRDVHTEALPMLTEVIRVRLELDSVHDQIVELCRRYGIAELSVFGSVAARNVYAA